MYQDGDCYTDVQCEAVVLCGNNHWIIMPNLTRSIQIDSWLGGGGGVTGPKSYLVAINRTSVPLARNQFVLTWSGLA